MNIPVPGGRTSFFRREDENEKEESRPLTPQQSLLQQHHHHSSSAGYLSFFRSPVVNNPHMYDMSALVDETTTLSSTSRTRSLETLGTPQSRQSEQRSVHFSIDEGSSSPEGSEVSNSQLFFGDVQTPNHRNGNSSRMSLYSAANESYLEEDDDVSTVVAQQSSTPPASSSNRDQVFVQEEQERISDEMLDLEAARTEDISSERSPRPAWGRHSSHQEASSRRISISTYQDMHPWYRQVWQTLTDEIQMLGELFDRRSPVVPLSPRSRNLADLHYLTQQHQNKMQQMTATKTSDPDGEYAYREDEAFDFCLVLQPQETYAFWASLLDFRAELLGLEAMQTMEAHWSSLFDTPVDGQAMLVPSSFSNTSSETSSSPGSEAYDVAQDLPSPSSTTGMRRRNRADSSFTPTPSKPQRSPSAMQQQSPSVMSIAEASRCTSRGSVFERAIGADSSRSMYSNPWKSSKLASPVPSSMLDANRLQETVSTQQRRRWGNHAAGSTPHAISPPIRSLTRGASAVRRPVVSRLPVADANNDKEIVSSSSSSSPDKPNMVKLSDIPSQVIPRGIASRTNGMLPFLSALKRGIVVRRHRPGQMPVFCTISSKDGGDTILFQPVSATSNLQNAFSEQRVRYNKASNSGIEHAALWSLSPEMEQLEESDETDVVANEKRQTSRMLTRADNSNRSKHFSVPDYVAAQQYREQQSTNRRRPFFFRKVNDLAKQVRSFKAADVIAVHPSRNPDPRSMVGGEYGSATLRKSRSEHNVEHTFSVVLRGNRLKAKANNSTSTLDELEEKWHQGEGLDSQFRYVDFEAATEGEYWLILRGLLLLHRDAAVGRFAEQRAAGIGSHYPRLELEHREDLQELEDPNILHKDEFNEPVTVSCLEKLVVKWRNLDSTYMEGFTLPEARPPPSDYFLGFKSPGTAIWSRLRYAGLETKRIYSLDPRQVMIKIRCPTDRLFDVAEVLRLHCKTHDGSFAPFKEDMLDLYQELNDPLEVTPGMDENSFQFRSSFRQTIIDFIVGSRIRDTGAELGNSTGLGRMIQSRVPLHMHDKLEAIYQSWFCFWKVENWQDGRDGRSLTHAPTVANSVDSVIGTSESEGSLDSEKPSYQPPSFFHRFFIGCFYQPLDSIEQYFGEKVAFYFAWLQHTTWHLTVLAVAGVFLFILQVASGKADHPLRPLFSMMVMLWTFTVLVNWRKRANKLAYNWGTMDYKEQETTRPEFCGDYARDEITGEWVVTYPKWKRWLKYMISFPLTIMFTCGTLLFILWVHANRDHQLFSYVTTGSSRLSEISVSVIGNKMQVARLKIGRDNVLDPQFWFLVVGMPSMLGLCLPLLNFILMKLAVLLNDFENYRTESEYRSSLIIKVFSFRFVCYFATLYYYSFVSVGDPTAIENGILRVGTGVLVYTTVAQWWQNLVHVCFPILWRKIRMRHRTKRLADELRSIEVAEEDLSRQAIHGDTEVVKEQQIRLINQRLLLEQAQDDTWLELMYPQHDSFPEYIQAVVQFTFVSCFSVVLPIAPLICLINYLISMRIDAYKLCRGRRRPLAEKTGGIGVWEHLLHIVAVISVLTNCWLMGFTSSQLTWIGEKVGQLALFAFVVAWEHVMLLIKYIIQTNMSPLPRSVRDSVKREQYEMSQQRTASMMARRLQHQQSKQE